MLKILSHFFLEFEARARDVSGLLVFAFGFNDAAAVNGSEPQIGIERSIENARQIIREARELTDLLWIGPTPLDESVNPMVTPFASWQMFNSRLDKYDRAYADLAADLEVDYLSLFRQFIENPGYQAALASADKVHPADEGYELIANIVEQWEPWTRRISR